MNLPVYYAFDRGELINAKKKHHTHLTGTMNWGGNRARVKCTTVGFLEGIRSTSPSSAELWCVLVPYMLFFWHISATTPLLAKWASPNSNCRCRIRRSGDQLGLSVCFLMLHQNESSSSFVANIIPAIWNALKSIESEFIGPLTSQNRRTPSSLNRTLSLFSESRYSCPISKAL